MKIKAFAFLFCALISGLQSYGQVSGKVIDGKNGDELINVYVLIKETNQATVTDIDGLYAFEKVAPGTYTLIFKFSSYKSKEVSGVVIAGKPVTLNVALDQVSNDIEELVVKAEFNKETVNTLLIKQKTATSISDGISYDVIRKSPDNTTSDVMKRISGASIQDNKFAIIRGLNDRYNIGYINGAPLPSTESDRKAFSFDIFPSNMLDNMVILKTATPELPADWAGGVIQINTKDLPDENYTTLQVGASVNTITTFKNQSYYDGGKTDWLGLDDGTRKLSSNLPSTHTYKNANDTMKYQYSKEFSEIWKPKDRKALPNGSFQLATGQKINLGKRNQLGINASLSYNNSNRFSEVKRRQYDVLDNNTKLYDYTDANNRNEILWGGLLNIAFKLGENHKFTLKNIYTVNSEDQTILRTGLNNLNQPGAEGEIQNTALYYTQNALLTNQLAGEHYLPKSKIKINWVGGFNSINRDVPDFRRVSYRRNYGVEEPFIAQIGSQVQLEQAGRFFSTLHENLYSSSANMSFPVNINGLKFLKTEVKFGVFYQHRQREFDARNFGYVVKGATLQNKIPRYALDSIFDHKNFYVGRYYLEEATNVSDSYDASSDLKATYLQFDNKLFTRLRLVWGVRVESFNQKLNSALQTGDAVNVDKVVTDFLPSMNMTYELTEKSNLRLCASKTLSRPEFREIAPFAFYDFNIDYVVAGNPRLVRSEIYNYDARWEFYPGNGQVVSVSAFYKYFRNPIEFINNPNSGAGSRTYGYANAPEATNYGMEFEFRKNLDFADEWFKTKFFSNLTWNGNFAYIFSQVDLSKFPDAGNGKRQLQGQSPYIINSGLQYRVPNTSTSFSFMVNRVGRRIAFVGNKQIPDIYENPRTILDFQFAFKASKHIDLKFNFSDLLAQHQVFYMDIDGNKRYSSKDNNIFDYTMGRNMGFSASYKF